MGAGGVRVLLLSGPAQGGGGVEKLAGALGASGLEVLRAGSVREALSVVRSDAALGAALVGWDTTDTAMDGPAGTGEVLRAVGERFVRLPVFLLVTGSDVSGLPLWAYKLIQGCVWPLEDTPAFIAGRIARAVADYREAVLPPFFRALRHFDAGHEFSWHTPGHAGGVAFLKSPAGRALWDFYGEALFRTDLSISVGELGSPLDHTGRIGAAERNAARVFGAEQTLFVMNGNSASNRIVGHATAADGESVLVDRNCHKSIMHALTLSGAVPRYLVPQRNGLGLAGPIPPSALARAGDGGPAVSAVVTNSTYDGLCYDAVEVAGLLAPHVPRIHFDEAWFAHGAFHPLYARRFGMAVTPEVMDDELRPTVFATQSTHKLLAALSQAAMVHVRPAPRAPVNPARFNETYLMHGTTSPSYPVIASLDVAAAMMDGASGTFLLTEAITEAVRFRQTVVSVAEQIREDRDRPGWFFGVWQPDHVATRPVEDLVSDPAAWSLEPGAAWHGFTDLRSGYCMLDPIKVTITCPGVTADGAVQELGIPARIVAAYLEQRGIVVEKTGDYTLLVLFSLGTTKGKWGTLIDALVDFKDAHDAAAPVEELIPDLGLTGPLPDLCAAMHAALQAHGLGRLLDQVFTDLPTPEVTPRAAHTMLIHDDVEQVPLDRAHDRVAASLVVVTPPGIPMLLPGENIGRADGPALTYLRALQAIDQEFPAFAADIHGVHRDQGGAYHLDCLAFSDSAVTPVPDR
ncbi:arginine decarboxylase [Actinomadura logoneensis]|uniref:Arginine decarboxylase n=2 Tax=Actinomadura logoneensis TaxID=2293572 RepID=A0A372JNV3_9ACTN|nr:arginine decarboxylase [Actinomadura logoneensis]